MIVYLAVYYEMDETVILDVYNDHARALNRCIGEAKKYLSDHPDYTHLSLQSDNDGAYLVVNGYAKTEEWDVEEFTVVQ